MRPGNEVPAVHLLKGFNLPAGDAAEVLIVVRSRIPKSNIQREDFIGLPHKGGGAGFPLLDTRLRGFRFALDIIGHYSRLLFRFSGLFCDWE